MSKQQNIVEDDFEYAVWIPDSTPGGQKATIQMREESGIHIMHAEFPDQSELYFEVSAYPAILDHDHASLKGWRNTAGNWAGTRRE